MSTGSRQRIVHPCRREMPDKPGWLRSEDIPQALRLRSWERRRLKKLARRCRDPYLQVRYRIVIALSQGMSPRLVAEVIGCSRDTVYVVQRRWIEYGEAGLIDRREDNGSPKATEEYVRELRRVLEKTPPEFGWCRPTWTRELLVLTMQEKGFPRISAQTMSRALAMLGARKGRPKPLGLDPMPPRVRAKRLREIARVLEGLGPDEVAVWQDEVDIHLNPKIGWDWMLPGQQREVPTPGQNEKRYVAGAMNPRTRKLIWVAGASKCSVLFIELLKALLRAYPGTRVIHVFVDNCKIHRSKQTQLFLENLKGRIQLHFLPTYDPDDNPIERLWQDLHSNVTRNHRYKTMDELMAAVFAYLRYRNRHLGEPYVAKRA